MLKNFILSATAAAALALPNYAQEAVEVAPATQDPATEAESALAPALKEIIANVPKLMDRKWKSNMTFNLDQGEDGSGKITVGLKYQDTKHFTADITFDMSQGEETMKGTANILADGEFLYLNGDLPAEMTQGLPLPVKIKMSLFDTMIASAGGPPEEGAEQGDLKSTLEEGLKEAFAGTTFKEEGTTETARRYVFENEELKGWITFGPKMWLPTGMEMKGDGNVMTMSSAGNAFVEKFPEGTFAFAVAEGQSVMDLTPMLEGMFGGPPAAAEEDLEF